MLFLVNLENLEYLPYKHWKEKRNDINNKIDYL